MRKLAQIIIIVFFTLGSSLVNAACNSTTQAPAIYFESASNTLPLGPTSWTGEANFYAIVNVTPGDNCTSVACTNSSCPLGESVCKTPNMNYCSIGANLCFNNTCNNTQTYTLYLMGQPSVNSLNKTGPENNALPFSDTDFNDQFITAEYANLAGLRIDTLPTNGTLELYGVPVITGQVIAADSINNLTFVPDPNWHGPTNFSWNANDGYIYAPIPANVNINIIKSNAPTVSGLSTNSGVIGNTVTTTINGSNFAIVGTTKPTVKLINGINTIENNITVTGVTPNQITCSINLTNTQLPLTGSWDVVVTNPDGQFGTLPGGILIESGVTPAISDITTSVNGNTLTITLNGNDFVNGVSGVTVQLINGSDTIAVNIIEVTSTQIIGIVDITANPQVLRNTWDVVLRNSDKHSAPIESFRIAETFSSATPDSTRSWLIPAIVVPTVVGASAIAASVVGLISYRYNLLCFRKNAPTSIMLGDVAIAGVSSGAAPIYSTSDVSSSNAVPYYSTT